MSKFTYNINQLTSAAPLVFFRICFGILMFISIVRFWLLGWIEKLYLEPNFHFTYYGFSWVKPLGEWTYLLFILCGLSALMVAVGWKYRIAIILFFISFTYIELMDKTTYLNHYYFISSLSLLLCFLPAGKYFSIDAIKSKGFQVGMVRRWTVDTVKLMICIVYFYAGLAKLHSDWLLDAMPLKIWLPGRYDIPLIGNLLEQEWVAYASSWGGAIYDLLIPFALFYKPTRWIAFGFVIMFHLLTGILFPIGMFPYIMIVGALIFFENSWHQNILNKLKEYLSKWFKVKPKDISTTGTNPLAKPENLGYKIKLGLVGCFFILQLLIPFRYKLYPGNLFWTEEGYRFSWRVMLMEKAGIATFKIVDGVSKQDFTVDNKDFLTAFQEKQMATQPDFIVEYAHYLRDHFESQGHQNIEIYVDSYVALNGQRSRPFIDPSVNLIKVEDSFAHKNWILTYE